MVCEFKYNSPVPLFSPLRKAKTIKKNFDINNTQQKLVHLFLYYLNRKFIKASYAEKYSWVFM